MDRPPWADELDHALPAALVSAGFTALVHHLRPSDGPAEGALVLLHDRGGDQRELGPMLEDLDPARRLLGLTPRAPHGLGDGRCFWFSTHAGDRPDEATFTASLERAANWLDAIPGELGIPIGRTVIGGVAQGAALAYALGFAAGRPAPAGVLALSGFMPALSGAAPQLLARAEVPVAIVHGEYDPVVPVALARRARERLEAAGAPVLFVGTLEAHTLAGGHLPEIQRWLEGVLPGE